MSKKKIFFVTSEMVPFTPTGALSEVSGSLPKALAANYEISLAMPLYSVINADAYSISKTDIAFTVPVSDRDELAEIWKGYLPGTHIPVYFIANHYFERDALYGNSTGDYPDNSERFVFFSRAALELCERIIKPDIIHCNDWQTSLVPLYLKEVYQKNGKLTGLKTVLTIHNLGYQGKFWVYDLHILNLGWEIFSPEKLEFYNHINYLKGGIVYADAVTTVSRRYAMEILTAEFGYGLEGVLKKYTSKLFGIISGVDTKIWDPASDKYLPFSYSAGNIRDKLKCRAALLDEFKIKDEPGVPVIGMVSRFNPQKGLDILVKSLSSILAESAVKFVVLGSGEKIYEDMIKNLADKYPDRLSLRVAHDERLSHLVHAGSDYFLMPSRYEPCGFSQMHAMAYGTPAIVRAVGGLDDTVCDITQGIESATGFKFYEYSCDALKEKIMQAADFFKNNRQDYDTIVENCIRQDFSWNNSALEYGKLYEEVSKPV